MEWRGGGTRGVECVKWQWEVAVGIGSGKRQWQLEVAVGRGSGSMKWQWQ